MHYWQDNRTLPSRSNSAIDYFGLLYGVPRIKAGLSILTGLLAFVVLYSVIAQFLLYLSYLVFKNGESWPDFFQAGIAYKNPYGLVAIHLGIASIIGFAIFWYRNLLLVPARHLISVAGKFRLRYLICQIFFSLILINASYILRQKEEISFSPQPQFLLFFSLILLTTPLQAIAEEVFFRGFINQNLTAALGSKIAALLGSSGIFALLHGAQNPALFMDRFGFALLASVIVLATGGLEAAIAIHIVNNISAFFWAGMSSSIAEIKATQVIGWHQSAWDLLNFSICILVAYGSAKFLKISRISEKN